MKIRVGKFAIGSYGDGPPQAPGPAGTWFVDKVRRNGALTLPVFEGSLEECQAYVDARSGSFWSQFKRVLLRRR